GLKYEGLGTMGTRKTGRGSVTAAGAGARSAARAAAAGGRPSPAPAAPHTPSAITSRAHFGTRRLLRVDLPRFHPLDLRRDDRQGSPVGASRPAEAERIRREGNRRGAGKTGVRSPANDTLALGTLHGGEWMPPNSGAGGVRAHRAPFPPRVSLAARSVPLLASRGAGPLPPAHPPRRAYPMRLILF